ncbi:hypothetical protein AB0D14_14815 [Streptomyces sp. NPDC048484]|uniref:hypothetical protein n=1 Tax=Streptomyces sp. NPDC048484 TaxID=3155146 RepID=UPI00341AAB76
MTTNRLTLLLAAGLTGLALLTTGCSSADDTKESNSSADSGSGGAGGGSEAEAADSLQKLRTCLREEKDMDVPDLKPGADPASQTLSQPDGVTSEAWQKAMKECGAGVPGGEGGSDSASQQNQDQQVRIAECMRGKGFEMPDPKGAAGPGVPAFKIPDGADPDKFGKALDQCAA